jgi:cytochrome P450
MSVEVFDFGKSPKQIDRYASLPFGAGPYVCPSASFPLREATTALTVIAGHFDVRVAPGFRVTPQLRVTLRPTGGLPMITHGIQPRIREKPVNRLEGR